MDIYWEFDKEKCVSDVIEIGILYYMYTTEGKGNKKAGDFTKFKK